MGAALRAARDVDQRCRGASVQACRPSARHRAGGPASWPGGRPARRCRRRPPAAGRPRSTMKARSRAVSARAAAEAASRPVQQHDAPGRQPEIGRARRPERQAIRCCQIVAPRGVRRAAPMPESDQSIRQRVTADRDRADAGVALCGLGGLNGEPGRLRRIPQRAPRLRRASAMRVGSRGRTPDGSRAAATSATLSGRQNARVGWSLRRDRRCSRPGAASKRRSAECRSERKSAAVVDHDAPFRRQTRAGPHPCRAASSSAATIGRMSQTRVGSSPASGLATMLRTASASGLASRSPSCAQGHRAAARSGVRVAHRGSAGWPGRSGRDRRCHSAAASAADGLGLVECRGSPPRGLTRTIRPSPRRHRPQRARAPADTHYGRRHAPTADRGASHRSRSTPPRCARVGIAHGSARSHGGARPRTCPPCSAPRRGFPAAGRRAPCRRQASRRSRRSKWRLGTASVVAAKAKSASSVSAISAAPR